MDSNASVELSKKPKTDEGQCNEDRISNLPEGVLLYILSSLPTKNAVGTSILSKRWKYLWVSIHNLDFSDKDLFTTEKSFLRRKKIFIKFVNRVLRFNDLINIQKFSLACWECDASLLNEWITKVLNRKVQELCLAVTFKDAYVLPICLFKSLNILKFDGKDFYKHMGNGVSTNLPSSLCLPVLKILHLLDIEICGEPLTEEVSLTCPILEELIMKDCAWWEIRTFQIFAPKLQVLTIKERYDRCTRLHDCEIKIYAESISSLKLLSRLQCKYYFDNLLSLVKTSIIVSVGDTTDYCVGSLLSQISNVKDLELSADCIQTLYHPIISANVFPFSRLTSMRVAGKTGSAPVNGRQLIDVLSSMPNVESLYFPSGLESFKFKGQGRLIGKTPQCYLSHLKLVDLGVFSGTENELWFIKFLMKSARVTNKLTINVGRCYYIQGWEQRKEKIMKQFESLVRHPKFCVTFSN